MRRKSQRRIVGSTIEGDTSNLLSELIYEILARLPVRSLMRFKSVCKSWRDLITEPEFIKTHLREAIKTDRKRVIYSDIESNCFFSVYLERQDKIMFPIKKYLKASVLSSCNGLVILGLGCSGSKTQNYVLWNPSFPQYKRFSYPFSVSKHCTFYGLSYSSIDDDYKFVLISNDGNDRDFKNYYYVVFRFKANSWTEQRKFPYKLRDVLWESWVTCFRQRVVCVEGAPHWVGMGLAAKEIESHHHTKVVYFDGASEKFKEFQLPIGVVIRDDKRRKPLVNFKGSLGYIHLNEETFGYEVWVMKEYGHSDSWTKMFTIPSQLPGRDYTLFLGLTQKYEIVLREPVGLAYDPTDLKTRTISTLESLLLCSETFVDSLVVPTGNKFTRKLLPNS